MKKLLVIGITMMVLWACNGAGSDVPAASDTTTTIHPDSMKTTPVKPDSTMRQ